jgi:tetratricopeptide (TPR) repeat protein
MSLLIKALQKAEQSKATDSKASASGSELSLEPVSSDISEPSLSSEGGFSASSTGRQNSTGQQAAATMFEAKGASLKNSGNSKKLLLIGGVSLLLLALLGMQLYSYLDSLKQPDLVGARPAKIPQPSSPVEAVATITPAPTKLVPPPDNPVSAAPAEVKAIASHPDAIEKSDQAPLQAKNEAVTLADQHVSARSKSARSTQIELGAPVGNGEDSAVKITRNNPGTGVPPALLSAYQAFNAGDDAAAQRYYRQVLQGDQRNVDALLGMAAIASRQGRNNDAVGWYGKVLEVEPRNSVAQAAMISTLGQTDPVGSESRIKSLLAQQPEAAHLYAALGNLYAEQGQWPAAQQAYFQAHHFAPNNAEYTFNLGVSLDQLNKPALALQYYKQALELLPKAGASAIDRAQLESRIVQLQ